MVPLPRSVNKLLLKFIFLFNVLFHSIIEDKKKGCLKMPTYTKSPHDREEMIEKLTKKAYQLSLLTQPEEILTCLNEMDALSAHLKNVINNDFEQTYLFQYLKEKFSCTYKVKEGEIEVMSGTTAILLKEINVEKNKFLFFFIKQNDSLSYDKTKKQHVLTIIQQAIRATKMEGLDSLILQYENMNKTCFLESKDLKRFTFTFNMDGAIAFSYPPLFESNLPKWYYRFPV
jgi:hypothetical protein